MATMLTAGQLEERTGGTFYTGPIEPAQNYLARHGYDTDSFPEHGKTTVLVGYTGEKVTWANCAEFGRAETPEIAWRYALGAAYGPVDDEFAPIDLDA